MSAFDGKELHIDAQLIPEGIKIDINIGPRGEQIEKAEGWMSYVVTATLEALLSTKKRIDENLVRTISEGDVELLQKRHEIELNNAKLAAEIKAAGEGMAN